jgi:hypothetical protein
LARRLDNRAMLDLLIRCGGVLAFAAGLWLFRLVPAVVQLAYAAGPGAGTAVGVAIFLGCALGVIALLMLAPPLVLGGLFAMLFGRSR